MDVIGEFSIGAKIFQVKKSENDQKVILVITEKGQDVPMSGSQISISKEQLSVCK